MAFAVFVIILTAAILIIVGLGLGPAGQITAAIVGLIVYLGIAGWLSTLIGKWIIAVMIFGPFVALAVWAFVMVAQGKRLAEPGKRVPEDNRRVSRWIEDHLRIAIVPSEDRDSLESVEQAVLDTLDPPFNLDGQPPTDIRRRLTELRRAITE